MSPILRRVFILVYVPYFFFALYLPSQIEHVLVQASGQYAYLGLCYTFLTLCALAQLVLLGYQAQPRWFDLLLVNLPAMLATVAIIRSGGETLVPILVALLSISATVAAWPRLRMTVSPQVVLLAVIWLVLTVGTVVGTIYFPIDFPRFLGVLGTLVVALGLIAIAVALLFLRPWIGTAVAVLFALVLLLSAPNNHDLRIAQSEAARFEGGISRTFLKWLHERKDLDQYKAAKRPYPVILVSSEGGGIYAAAHAYAALRAFQDRCASFAQHVYATVGVSGGSFGNLLFAESLARSEVNAPLKPCKLTDARIDMSALARDHLSPVLARMLFAELLDALLPGRLFQDDRASVLALSMRDALPNPSRIFDLPVRNSFDTKGNQPLLIFVSTDVQRGQRFVFSPLTSDWGQSLVEWFPAYLERDVTVADAASTSARFPWITPTARLSIEENRDRLLGDGGYFENSGAETVLDVIRDIRTMAENKAFDKEVGNETDDPKWTQCQLKIEEDFEADAAWSGCDDHVFFAHYAISTVYQDPDDEDQARLSQSFLFDPMRTMLNAREARGVLALDRSKTAFCGLGACITHFDVNSGFYSHTLPLDEIALPLGWFLSSDQAKAVAALLPSRRCTLASDDGSNPDYKLVQGAESGRGSTDMSENLAELIEGNVCDAEVMAYLFNPELQSVNYGVREW